jgi:hypothetical protein
VVYNGCAIGIVAPTGPVTADANHDPADGAQVSLTVQVDPACDGQTITTSCGLDSPSTSVAGNGSASLLVDWCGVDPCELTAPCTLTVTDLAGVATSVSAPITFDDKPPAVAVQILKPAVNCGDTISAAADIDGNATNGVQIKVRVFATLPATRSLDQTDASGTTTVAASSDVVATIAAGDTTFVGHATDPVGNSATSSPCDVILQ